MKVAAVSRARQAFVDACRLDVSVRKPGNVSLASSGHGMRAEQFIASAAAASGPLFMPGARVGSRIEGAGAATWRVAGCNTNLGILLLCAPLARAAESVPATGEAPAWRAAVTAVLDDLDLDDTRAAYRAIAAANPGGLGSAPREDVQNAPTLKLRDAMALAADRDLIARQYADGYAALFEIGLPALGAWSPSGFGDDTVSADASTTAAVQRLFLRLLARLPDSHIVRKHGEAVAHNVMATAQRYSAIADAGMALDAAEDFVAWDDALKAARINPGTTADLTVASLMLAGTMGSA